jgi:hypothetical protein
MGNSPMFKAAMLAGSIGLGATLAGCANKYETLTPEIQAKMMDDLKAGRLVLDCGAKCSFTWIAKVDSIHTYDTAERWPELAQTVMQVGYGQDLAYYYLGQAAQGLGYHEAAITYYKWAYALNTGQDATLHCTSLASETHDPCQGVDLAGSIPILIKASQDAIAARDAAAQPAPAPAPVKHTYHHPKKPPATATPAASTPPGWALPPPAPTAAPAQ